MDAIYVIPNSFHPLLRRIHRIIRKTRLGEFLAGSLEEVSRACRGSRTVSDEWIIKTKTEGKRSNDEIAKVQEVSVRRV